MEVGERTAYALLDRVAVRENGGYRGLCFLGDLWHGVQAASGRESLG